MLSDLLNGLKIDPYGPAPVPANRSRQRASRRDLPTNAICGLSGSGSSESASLQSFLVSRLKQRFGTAGSMEYSETWKQKATPAGRRYWAHTAFQPRTSDNGCTGWPTPTSLAVTDGHEAGNNRFVAKTVRMAAGWRSPRARSKGGGWNTNPETAQKKLDRGQMIALEDHVLLLVGWGTPRATDGTHGGPNQGDPAALPRQVACAGWPSPRANKWGEPDSHGKTALGPTSTSSLAPTARSGGLNPAHSRWLQGYPRPWCQAAIRAYRMCKRRQKGGK